MKKRTVFDAIADVNECGRQRKKKSRARYFSPAQELALIALHPFLEVIGGRIAMMLEQAIEATDDNGKNGNGKSETTNS